MKILNLYAGIGCNRALWSDEHEITAVEIDKDIASIYSARFYDDVMVVGDAHQYLLDHYKEFDFIWSSVPCQTHSIINFSIKNKRKLKYPDMKLWQEIIFLKSWFEGYWVVENVVPYYDVFLKESVKIDRHLFWSNFKVREMNFKRSVKIRDATKEELAEYHNIDEKTMRVMVDMFGGDARRLLRNGLHEKIGKYVLDSINKVKIVNNL